MRTLKRAEQKNVIVNAYSLNADDILRLLKEHKICWFDKDFEERYDTDIPDTLGYSDIEYRIFLCNTKEIKVVYNVNFGYYETVVVTNDGETIPVTL